MNSRRTRWSRDHTYAAVIGLLAVLGLVARLWNVDFDHRQHQHPDERFWAITSDAMANAPEATPHGTALGPVLDWLDGDRSPASVYRATPSFVYGPVSLATARAAAGWLHDGVTTGRQPASAVARLLDGLGVPLIDDAGAPRFDDRYQVDLIGRVQGAFVDSLTIVVVAAIGRRLGGRIAGVCAAAFAASSVMAIQLAHFLGAEPLLGLGSALTLLCALRLDRGNASRRAATTGLALGSAMGLSAAAKLTAAGLLLVPAVGCVALALLHRRRSDVVRVLAVVLGAGIAFRVCNPGAFDGLGMRLSSSYRADLRLTSTLPTLETPPSFQWARRIPGLQPLWWLSAFVIGPGTVVAAVFGTIAMTTRRWTLATPLSRWTRWVTLAAIAVPFTYIVVTTFPTARYFLPMTPALFAVAGSGGAAAIRWTARARGRVRLAPIAIVVLSFGPALFWTLGFVHGVHGRENTRIEASRWIAEHIPAGSAITSEAWDDVLPLSLPGIDASAYRNVQLVLVEPDDEAKIDRLASQLAGVDYVIESSARIWGTVTRMPARFPSTINFFEGLESGALGFERVATFESGIELFGLGVPEGSAEEAFSVYDHPEVRIWERVRDVDRRSVIDVLDPAAASNALAISAFDAHANGLLLFQDEVARNAEGMSYDEAFDVDGSGWVHAVRWFVLLELLGAAAFVLFLPLFRRLPDAGLGLSKIVALAVIAGCVFVTVTWIGVALDRWLVVSFVGVFIAAGVGSGIRRRSALRDLWFERRAVLVSVELVGAALFVALVLLRSADPDLWNRFRSGEKPFELALLTAVLRTRTLPVYDPWFSGGSLNYYYGGWLLLSIPSRLARTSPSTAMNLAPALFATCSAGAVFTTSAGVVAATRRRWRRSRLAHARAIGAGMVGIVLVLLASNATVLRLRWHALWVASAPPFDWWAASRVIPNSVAITEFPAWSLLFADVHPHVMDIAVLVAIGPVCLVLHRALVEARLAHAISAGVLAGVLLGLVRMTNTWDVPLATGIVALTFIAAVLQRVDRRLLVASGVTIVTVVTVAFAPYTWRGMVFDAGLDPAELRTPWASWLEHFVLFAIVTLLAVADGLMRRRRSKVVWRSVTEAHLAVAASVLIGVGYVLLRPGRSVFVTCMALALASTWSTWRALCDRRHRRSPIAPALLTIGWSIQAAVEVFNVRNDGGRTNTVFKFWYQSWIVLGLGAAVVLTELFIDHRRSHQDVGRWPRWSPRLAMTAAVAVAVTATAFWVLAVPQRVDDRISTGGLSLDGEAYLRAGSTASYDDGITFTPDADLVLVDWLRANVDGIQVVAEAPGIDYQWTSRVSWLTGLPTPIGWPYHETQQRRAFALTIETRVTDMHDLYAAGDPKVMARVLSKYDVGYVVYGTQERRIASTSSAAALAAFPCLTIEARGGGDDDDLFVASVDRACVKRQRPFG